MKKLLVVLALAGVSFSAMAQDADPVLKNSVVTNSFWSNWFVQVGAQWDAFYPSQSNFGSDKSPLKSFRSSPEAAVAIGKWFSPEIGMRLKANGIWGKTIVGKNESEKFKFWNIHAQPIFNLSNIFCGYNPNRVWNLSLFGGAGLERNMTADCYAMGVSAGILNQFYVCKRVAINLELGYNYFEGDFDGLYDVVGPRGFDSHDNILYAELGLTYNIGKVGWRNTPDVDAIKALSQSQIDALNAQLADANGEIARLKNLLANQPKPEPAPVPDSVKEFITTPVSVFFNIGKTEIAELKDLVNVQALAKYAIANDNNLLVTGYADKATGKEQLNQTLSEKRAKRVADELVKMGVAESKIKQEAKGGVDILSPISYNRRATVQITD